MKLVKIDAIVRTREVFVDDVWLSPAPSQGVVNHSPDGFMWGYGGSGPSQLALAILMKFTDVEVALRHYHDFKREHVSQWDMDKDVDVVIDISPFIEEVEDDDSS